MPVSVEFRWGWDKNQAHKRKTKGNAKQPPPSLNPSHPVHTKRQRPVQKERAGACVIKDHIWMPVPRGE